MGFRFNLPIEVDRPSGELISSTSAVVQLVCQGAKWRAQCQDPPVATLLHDTIEEALVAAVKDMQRDWAQTGATAEASADGP